MASGTRDLTVVPNQEGDESSMVIDPSIQASLQRTSSVASENYIAAGGDLSAGMESSIPVASSRNSEIIEEIIEAEDDPSPGMEPSLQVTSSMLEPAKDEQISRTDSTTIFMRQVNPFLRDLSKAKSDKEVLAKHYSELKQKLKDGLQEEAVYAFLDHDNKTEAQEKVQELLYLSEAIEYVISNWRQLLKTPIQETDPYQPNFKADYHRIDIYHYLFIHTLSYANKLRESPSVDVTHLASIFAAKWSEYFGAIDLMVFLINKVQEEEDNKDPSLAFQEAKTSVTKFVHRHEEETISTVICLVVNDEDKEAEFLFRRLLKHMKPSDIINRGRIFNYALQKAQELLEVYKCLSSPCLSQRYKDVVRCYNRLKKLAKEYDNQAKVQRFLVNLYLKNSWWNPTMVQEIDWEFVEQHDYLYLIQCLWKTCYQCMMLPYKKHDRMLPMHLHYVFTSSAAIVGGQDIMKRLLQVWPTLDVNASYKGVAALHVAAFKGNEEVIKFLFTQKEFDINVGIERLHAGDDVPRSAISGKKWNKNRWELPAYQTALHIAISQRQTKVVKLLCGAPEPHQQRLRCHEEDENDQTPLDILYGGQRNKLAEDFVFSEIEKILLSMQHVQNFIDRLYRTRQVLVDAINTILLGAALIAGVTFVGWLQPPLGYAQYYDLVMPSPAPPDTYNSYLAVQGNLGVKAFALFNSLSFFFAIATVIVGANAAFPIRTYQYIGHVVQTMHCLLQCAIKYLIISLVCVLGAFSSAAIVVLPPSLFFRKDLMLTIIIGGGVCGYALWQLLSQHSVRVLRLNAYIRHIMKFTNVF